MAIRLYAVACCVLVLPSKPKQNIVQKTCKNCTLNNIHYGGNIHLFSIFSDILLFFHKYMKNKIGILENNNIFFP